MANPYDGIGEVGEVGWTAKSSNRPLSIQDVQNLFDEIERKEKEDWKRMREWGASQREARKKDPKKYDAEVQAALECFGRQGDPVNPVIASPKQIERFERRVKQILSSPEPLDFFEDIDKP